MKKSTYFFTGVFAVIALSAIYAFRPLPAAWEYKQFSTIESIVPGGLGRSRILTTDATGTLVEKEIQNFYSMVGINFGNIANNDRMIVDKINEWTNDGWELYQVTTGSSTSQSKGDTSNGIFISRYLFRRAK